MPITGFATPNRSPSDFSRGRSIACFHSGISVITASRSTYGPKTFEHALPDCLPLPFEAFLAQKLSHLSPAGQVHTRADDGSRQSAGGIGGNCGFGQGPAAHASLQKCRHKGVSGSGRIHCAHVAAGTSTTLPVSTSM